jgi:hypothetical protein
MLGIERARVDTIARSSVDFVTSLNILISLTSLGVNVLSQQASKV